MHQVFFSFVVFFTSRWLNISSKCLTCFIKYEIKYLKLKRVNLANQDCKIMEIKHFFVFIFCSTDILFFNKFEVLNSVEEFYWCACLFFKIVNNSEIFNLLINQKSFGLLIL